MNLSEYWNQEPPKKLGAGSVEVLPKDCFTLRLPTAKMRGWCTIKRGENYYTYVLVPYSSTLYVMDQDGNPRNPSVFFLKTI